MTGASLDRPLQQIMALRVPLSEAHQVTPERSVCRRALETPKQRLESGGRL